MWKEDVTNDEYGGITRDYGGVGKKPAGDADASPYNFIFLNMEYIKEEPEGFLGAGWGVTGNVAYKTR
jgi:hypothetical protein